MLALAYIFGVAGFLTMAALSLTLWAEGIIQ